MGGPGRRWQHLLADALVRQPVAGVRAVIEQEVGRPATRAELHAGRRAAHRLAEAGHCQLRYINARRSGDGQRSKMLLIGRIGMAPTDWPDDGALERAANAFPTRTPAAGDPALAQLITAVAVAHEWAAHVDPDGLTAEEAARAVAQLSKPVQDLYLLRRELKKRAKGSKSTAP